MAAASVSRRSRHQSYPGPWPLSPVPSEPRLTKVISDEVRHRIARQVVGEQDDTFVMPIVEASHDAQTVLRARIDPPGTEGLGRELRVGTTRVAQRDDDRSLERVVF